MNNLVLITRPNYDIPTSYLYSIADELVKEIKLVGEHRVIDLEGTKATKVEFDKALDKADPRLVVMNGHGAHNCVYGQSEIILDQGNVGKLNSRIVCAIACDSAENLGEFAVSTGGAQSYVGYESRFMVIVDPARSAVPMKDKSFKPFREIYNTLILNILAGRSISQAVEQAKVHTRSLIREYGVRGIRDKFGDAPIIRFALYWNLMSLTYRGSGDAKF